MKTAICKSETCKTALNSALKPLRKLGCSSSLKQGCSSGRKLNFWQAFGLSLGLSVLMTGLAVLAQRQLSKRS